MRRLVKSIFGLAILLGVYYVAQLPNSPILVDEVSRAHGFISRTSEDISTRAREQDISLPKAAAGCLFDAVGDKVNPRP